MMLTFHSIDDENNKIIFKSEYKKNNNIIIFEDKSVENTMIFLTINEDNIIFERKGNINMKLILHKNIKTQGYYQNELGLDFKFNIITSKLEYNKNKINIGYSMYLDEDLISTHKIWILFH